MSIIDYPIKEIEKFVYRICSDKQICNRLIKLIILEMVGEQILSDIHVSKHFDAIKKLNDIDVIVESVKTDDLTGINKIVSRLGNTQCIYNSFDFSDKTHSDPRIEMISTHCDSRSQLSSFERILLMRGYFSLVLKIRNSDKNKRYTSKTILELLYSILIYYSPPSSRDYHFKKCLSSIPKRCNITNVDLAELVERVDYRNYDDGLVVNTQALFELLINDIFRIMNANEQHNFGYDFLFYNVRKECHKMLNDIYVNVIEQLISNNNEAYIVPLFDSLFNNHLEIPSGKLFLLPQIQNSRIAIDILLDILDAKRKREIVPELQSKYKQLCERKGIYQNISGGINGPNSLYVDTHGIDLDELCSVFDKTDLNNAQKYLQARLMNMRRDEILIPINRCDNTSGYSLSKVLCLMVIVIIELSYKLPYHNYNIRSGLFFLWIILNVCYCVARRITFPSECHKLDTGVTPHRKLIDSMDILYGIIILPNWIIYEAIGGSGALLARQVMMLQVICALSVNMFGRYISPWRYRKFTIIQ